MSEVLNCSIENGVGLLLIDSPPVNALGAAVRQGLRSGLTAMIADAQVDAIVILCAGRTFFAGADITEFGKPPQEPNLLTVLDMIEASPKPVVAAIHGTALGGGLELALACNYRVAVPSAKVGLPEVHLGILPGAGGTQRLPRLIGPERAMDLIVKGTHVKARDALDYGIVDALAEEGHLRRDAIAFARDALQRPLVRVRDREDKIAAFRGNGEIFADYRRRNARALRGFRAPENIIKTIEAAVELPFDQGMQRERELFVELVTSRQSQAMRHVFFAERQTSKVLDLPNDTPLLSIETVGVIGAGTMGGGIAMCFLDADMPVTLVETSQEALDRGLAIIRRNYETSASKGRLTTEQVERRMGLITPAIALDALANVDLVIEAVFEEMAVKRDIFARLDKVAKPGAILGSNTSFLSIDEIAAATSRPESVIGLHFFSPANVMRLLEVVRGEKTSKPVIATSMKLAKRIAKVPVLSRVCHGFIANRMMSPRMRESYQAVLEGASPEQVDKAIYDYGFAMGPFQMLDLVGLDVIGRGANDRSLAGDLVKRGRLGQKKNGGFYDYDADRKPTASAVAREVIAVLAAAKGIQQKPAPSNEDIIARLLYVVVNEGAKILEEGVALRASDIDMAAILGYNWPVYTGGPMFWADTVGIAVILDRLKALEAEYGQRFKPATLLETMAAAGERFADR